MRLCAPCVCLVCAPSHDHALVRALSRDRGQADGHQAPVRTCAHGPRCQLSGVCALQVVYAPDARPSVHPTACACLPVFQVALVSHCLSVLAASPSHPCPRNPPPPPLPTLSLRIFMMMLLSTTSKPAQIPPRKPRVLLASGKDSSMHVLGKTPPYTLPAHVGRILPACCRRAPSLLRVLPTRCPPYTAPHLIPVTTRHVPAHQLRLHIHILPPRPLCGPVLSRQVRATRFSAQEFGLVWTYESSCRSLHPKRQSNRQCLY